MNYQVMIGENNEIPLPDELCSELNIKVGDILFCEVVEKLSKISMTKHSKQTLSDADIATAGNLTRVLSCAPK